MFFMNIRQVINFLIIVLVSLLLSLVSYFFSDQQPSKDIVEYRNYYDNLPDRDVISSDEYNELKEKERELIKKLESSNYKKRYVGQFVGAKVFLVVLIGLFWILIAFKYHSKFTYKSLIFCCFLIFVSGYLIVGGLEAILYASVFYISSLLSKIIKK